MLTLSNLHISTADDNAKELVRDLSLSIAPGELHVLLGPNGSGKSSLANALMGHPSYTISSGALTLNGEDLTEADPDKRAKAGLFLSMQHPPELSGVSLSNFLRTSYNALHDAQLSPVEFHKLLKEQMTELQMDPTFAGRNVNEGFSGGEKKRAELLQLLVLQPTIALLDEIDSGVDIDARAIIQEGIRRARANGTGILLITHHAETLEALEPTAVSVLEHGTLKEQGGPELAQRIASEGFGGTADANA